MAVLSRPTRSSNNAPSNAATRRRMPSSSPDLPAEGRGPICALSRRPSTLMAPEPTMEWGSQCRYR